MGKQMRWWIRGLGACCVAFSASAAWADEATDAGVRAEIQVLKDRLSRLEGQVTQPGMQGISSIADKPAPGALELPSGLAGLQMSGFVDTSYVYSFNEPNSSTANRARVFDTEANGFTPHLAELVFEKPMTDSMPIGFRTDLDFGDDAEVFHSTGGGVIGADQFDLQQAYITAQAPIGEGLDFKVGKFVTLLGAEVIESPANWNFSRSYLFGFAIPFTHTGALASYPIGEWGSATVGVVNGWDVVDDNNKAKTLLASVSLTPFEGTSFIINGITGAERSTTTPATLDNKNKRSVLDLVATYQALDNLTLMANYDFGHESSVAPAAVGTAGGAPGFDTGEWQGLALYAKYDLSPTWSLTNRFEWFDDKDAIRTGLGNPEGIAPADVDYYEWTLTSQWTLHEHVIARLEYRHDKADEQMFIRDQGFTDYQDTVAAEMIYHF